MKLDKHNRQNGSVTKNENLSLKEIVGQSMTPTVVSQTLRNNEVSKVQFVLQGICYVKKFSGSVVHIERFFLCKLFVLFIAA
jgi:hypothetical protein